MIWIWVVVVLAIYAVLLTLVAWKSINPFRLPIFMAPGQLDLPQEKVEFTTRDGIGLKGWWIENEAPRWTAIFCHGYMMNRSELVALAAMMHRHGASCLLFDFRAHGDSHGKKTGLGWYEREDARAAAEFARQRQSDLPIVFVGSSMGSAAAVFAVGEDPSIADALILDSVYSRLDWAAVGWWRFLGGKALMAICWPTVWLSRWMLGFRLRDADVAKYLVLAGKPTLLLHGEHDQLALPREATRNCAAIPEHSTLVWFERCNHSGGRYFRPEEFNRAVFDWLDENVIARVAVRS